MGREETAVVKADIPDNAEAVRNHAEFIGITEVAVYVHLLYGGIGGGMGRHGAISSFIGVVRILQAICLFKGFELSDDAVGVFGIVFRDPGLNPGGVKQSHGGFLPVNALADGLSEIDHMVKHSLKIGKEVLFEAGEFGSIGNDIKAAELTQFPGVFEENDQEGDGRDGENEL